MTNWLSHKRYSPIGIDIGGRSVKLVQFTADYSKLVDATRWDLPIDIVEESDAEQRFQLISEGIRQVEERCDFRGRDAVLCLSQNELFLQNIRVQKTENLELDQLVQREAAGRLPFSVGESEIRYLEAADVRQGDSILREVIVMACHRPMLEQILGVLDKTKLNPIAVDVEPHAVVRSYTSQYRRDKDRQERSLFVHIEYANTMVVIAQGDEILFIKYLDIGGRHLNEAVSHHLKMELPEAAALRLHNGDRRSDLQDPEISRGIKAALRPILERLASELSMCVRYHSITFRGHPLVRIVLGGEEATTPLKEMLENRLDIKADLSDPLSRFETPSSSAHSGQWDVAVGLAMREGS